MIKLVKRLGLFVVIGLLLFLSPHFVDQQGYVLISFGQWNIEGSVVSFVLALFMALFLIWLTVTLVKYTITAFVFPSKWWRSRQLTNQSNFLQSGIDFMTMGQWQLATNQFNKVKRLERIETAKQLKLVCAAHGQTEGALALPQDSDESTGAVFTQLSQLKQQHKHQQAQPLLDKIKPAIHKQPLPLQQLYFELQVLNFAWNDVSKHLPKLNKLITKNSDEAAKQAWVQHLKTNLQTGFDSYVEHYSANQLRQLWDSWTKSIKSMDVVLDAYLSSLDKHQQHQLIENELLAVFNVKKADWLLTLVRRVYQRSNTVPMPKLFVKVQQAASKNKDNKTLLTLLAYLAAGDKDHQLAKQALEQVVFDAPEKTDRRLYACTLAELGEMRHSVEVFKTLESY